MFLKNLSRLSRTITLGLLLILPALAPAETWHAQLGAQSRDKGRQVLAFLPNEMWIHTGDSITWKMATDEPHTVSFLKAGQVRPPFTVGCPGATPDGSFEDGTGCVNSGVMANDQSYSVMFPAAGSYKLTCLFHSNMTAVVHVLDLSQKLPHDQQFYDEAARARAFLLLASGEEMNHAHHSHLGVTAGTGKVVATGGGTDTVSVMRFMFPAKVIHAGQTVEWTNDDPVTAHTITFGVEPQNLIPPSPNVSVDPDEARHATVASTSDNVNSGFLKAAAQDQTGSPQTPLGGTRFRVTFPNPGVFNYICGLHDELGMVGEVIVLP